jgi:hypothetical protein
MSDSAKGAGTRRLNLVMSERAYSKMAARAESRGATVTEMVNLGLSILNEALKPGTEGYRLMLCDRFGTAVKEIILPQLEAKRSGKAKG